jgi:3-phenylpropionate/cinnamic acid dioxygenase small subunit
VSATLTMLERDAAYFLLKGQIEEFLFDEAALLDERRFTEWLDLLADDLHYFMPVRRNVRFGEHAANENTRSDGDSSWFDEDKWTLA